jgi:bifunctional ADP-heptose synthase (sugar kinase/adenylyltransferase)
MIGKNKTPKNILVIGEPILDHEIKSEVVGMSLETPTLKTKFISENYTFGGAANVVANLLALGEKVTFIAPVATDKYANTYQEWDDDRLRLVGIPYSGENVVKSRYWLQRADSIYKYLQINQGSVFNKNKLIAPTIEKELKSTNYDSAILVDYRNGIFNKGCENTQTIIQTLINSGVKVYAASQTSDKDSQYHVFSGVDLICLNLDEASTVLGRRFKNDKDLVDLSKILRSRVCVTMGAAGSMLQTLSGTITEPCYQVEAIDTCGAGDCFLAALVASDENLPFSNKWAAASVRKIGTNVPDLEEVLSWT